MSWAQSFQIFFSFFYFMNTYKSKKMKIDDSYKFAQICMPSIILAVRAWREIPVHATPVTCRSLSHTAQQTQR